MSFTPQNFVDKNGPVVSSAFLNGVDILANQLLGGSSATTGLLLSATQVRPIGLTGVATSSQFVVVAQSFDGLILARYCGAAQFPNFMTYHINGSPGAETPVVNNDVLGVYDGGGYNGVGLADGGGYLVQAIENWSISQNGSAHSSYVTPAGQTAPLPVNFWSHGGCTIGSDTTNPTVALLGNSAKTYKGTFSNGGAGSQPAFEVHRSALQTLTFSGSTTILFDVEDVDQASNYNTGTGIFTAPLTGIYLFTAAVGILTGAGGATLLGGIQFSKNGDTTSTPPNSFGIAIGGPFAGGGVSLAASSGYTFGGSTIMHLTAGDTVKVVVTLGTGFGTPQATNGSSYFTGTLLS